MRTARSQISQAITKWFDKGDPIEGKCKLIKLVHVIEGGVAVKLETYSTPAGCDINNIITEIEDDAKNHAANRRGGIVEEYAIIPIFNSGAEGGYKNFSVNAAIQSEAESGLIGQFTEGPNQRGEAHQDMRHKEAMARIYVDGISRNQEVSDALLSRVMTRNENLETRLDAALTAAEEAKDRTVERQLAVFKAYEEEQRTTKLVEGLIPAAMTLANAAMGRPLFPVSSDDNTVNMFKNWVRSLTIEQMENFRTTLDPQQYMPLLVAKEQVMDEDEAKEKEKKAEAEKKVQGIMHDENVKKSIANRDAAGIARDPLVGK